MFDAESYNEGYLKALDAVKSYMDDMDEVGPYAFKCAVKKFVEILIEKNGGDGHDA